MSKPRHRPFSNAPEAPAGVVLDEFGDIRWAIVHSEPRPAGLALIGDRKPPEERGRIRSAGRLPPRYLVFLVLWDEGFGGRQVLGTRVSREYAHKSDPRDALSYLAKDADFAEAAAGQEPPPAWQHVFPDEPMTIERMDF